MRTIEKNGDSTQNNDQNYIAFICNGESIRISGDDILYIEQCGAKLLIRQSEKEMNVPGRMRTVSNVLSEPFFQCHAYLLVNFSKIESLTIRRIVFKNQLTKELSRDCYYKTRKLFNEYLARTSKII